MRVVAVVAVVRSAGDDGIGMSIDAEPGRQRGRVGQRVAGSGRGEVAGDIE